MVSAFCWYILVVIRGRKLEITAVSVATLLASSTTDLKSDNISVVVLGESQSLTFIVSPLMPRICTSSWDLTHTYKEQSICWVSDINIYFSNSTEMDINYK